MAKIKHVPVTCHGHTRPVVDLSYNNKEEDGLMLLSCSKDSKAIVRNGLTGDWIGTLHGHKGAIWCCGMNEEVTIAATGSADFSVRLWDLSDGTVVSDISHCHIVRSLAFAAGSGAHKLATCDNKYYLNLYDLNDTKEPVYSTVIHTNIIRKIRFIDNNKRLLTLSDDKSLCLWDLSECREKPVLKFKHGIDIPSKDMKLRLSPDNVSMVAAFSQGTTVEIVTLDMRMPIEQFSSCMQNKRVLSVSSEVASIALHPRENLILCGCADQLIYKLDMDSGNELDIYRGHFGPVHCLDFAPGDGKLFASGSEDGTVRLWQKNAGEQLGLWRVKLPETPLQPLTSNS